MKIITSDNGSEFLNAELLQFLSENGIQHETSASYCPSSNGRIEREIRTIKDTARTIMQRYKTPEFLWAESVATAVYVRNRLLSKQSPDLTAYEQVFKKKPRLSHFRVFGCEAIVHMPDVKAQSGNRREKGLFLWDTQRTVRNIGSLIRKGES